ncbi:MAG TPA: hypothetical protein ENN72_00405 [Firmicutes bacterium]|nr:hypothetical protein [Bacillota bacterium]
MKRIVFAGMVLSVLLFTGCASKRNYIVRMDASEMKSVVANEKEFFVAEGNELDIKVAPVFGKNGYLLLYVDAENKSDQPVHMDYTNISSVPFVLQIPIGLSRRCIQMQRRSGKIYFAANKKQRPLRLFVS